MTSNGFAADPDELDGMARQVYRSVDLIGDHRLNQVVGDASEYGHTGLHGAMSQLLNRVHGAVDRYRGDAESTGHDLRATAADYTYCDADTGSIFGRLGGDA